METCVLIPQEFSLVVASVVGSKKHDPVVSVWSTARIPQGTRCYPFQGTVRIDKLEVYSYIDEDDVSTFFHYSSFFCLKKKQKKIKNSKKKSKEWNKWNRFSCIGVCYGVLTFPWPWERLKENVVTSYTKNNKKTKTTTTLKTLPPLFYYNINKKNAPERLKIKKKFVKFLLALSFFGMNCLMLSLYMPSPIYVSSYMRTCFVQC